MAISQGLWYTKTNGKKTPSILSRWYLFSYNIFWIIFVYKFIWCFFVVLGQHYPFTVSIHRIFMYVYIYICLYCIGQHRENYQRSVSLVFEEAIRNPSSQSFFGFLTFFSTYRCFFSTWPLRECSWVLTTCNLSIHFGDVKTRWWFQIFFISTPIWGRFLVWLIFFKWVVQPPTSKQLNLHQKTGDFQATRKPGEVV